MTSVLVTGGAGYIGSHAVKALVDRGHRVAVVDDLSRGYRAAVHPTARFYRGDILDSRLIERILHENDVETVLHFAALAQVAESVSNPLRYYSVNTTGTIRLLEAMQKRRVKRLVFSSTCAVYGNPAASPVTENTPENPVSPYGRSKLFAESAVADFAKSEPAFRYIVLRYFNVAGCAFDGTLGEETIPQTRLIPSLIAAALQRREPMLINGSDYETPDGTCVRDYIHVEDLVQAHLLALSAIDRVESGVVNLGSGRGYSVMEVVDAVERASGHPVPTRVGPRRFGDASALWTDFEHARSLLGWAPTSSLEDMVATAWRWFRDHPDGYRNSSDIEPWAT